MTIRHDKKERTGGAGIAAETRIGEGVEGEIGGWTDGHAKGARGCATTNPQPPANSAAARRSARSTGSNATTAYNTSPSRSPSVYLAAATLLRSARFLRFSLSPLSSSCSSSPAADSHTPPLSFTCVHTRGMMPRLLSLFLSFPLVAADSARERVRSAIRIRRKRIARFSSALWNCRGETRRRDAHVNAGYDVPTRSLTEGIAAC